MKRLLCLLVTGLLLALTGPALAQQPGPVYLPVIIAQCGEPAMSDWKIVVPEATTNKALNPSAETTANYAALAGATVIRSSSYQSYGLYAYHVITGANNDGISLTLGTLANAVHYVTVRVLGGPQGGWDWSLDNATYTAPALLEAIDGSWSLYGLQFPAAQASGSTTLYIRQNGATALDFYLDGIQAEEKTTWTTYCDGTQAGCAWNGPAHAASSTRSAASRAGGRIYDLQSDYYLNIGGMSGTGTPPQALSVNKYAVLPGGELSNIKVNSRVMTLTGVISGSSWSDLHSKKQALINVLSADAYPEDADGPQPVRLRYQGAAVHKEIAVHYENGLEGEFSATEPCAWEKVAIRFIADDPYWYEIGESAAELDTNDYATFNYVAVRFKSTGQWSNLGPPAASGAAPQINAFAEDGTYVYIGGAFLNFAGIANADAIVRYNKSTGAFSAMGTGGDDAVFALAIGPDGSVYAGGGFTLMGGVANTAKIARWDGANWNALGTGASGGDVLSLAIGPDGLLYAGGVFTLAGGVADTVRIAKWNGSVWAPLDTGLVGAGDVVYALALDLPARLLYVGGDFTTGGGNPADYIAVWDLDTSSWSALSGQVDNVVMALAVDQTGRLYAGGNFTSAGGVTANYIAVWSGQSWSPLGAGLTDIVQVLTVAPDGDLYIGGGFVAGLNPPLSDAVARWNGSAYSSLDIDLPGGSTAYAIMISQADPVVSGLYDLWLGFNTAGVASYDGKATVTNGGNVPTYPQAVFGRSGGTEATVITLRNETTSKELLFNYDLQSGETLTVNMVLTQKSITSSFFGPRQDAILPNCDFGEWALMPGSNNVTSFVTQAGNPTMTAYLSWKDTYKSQD